ncbi:MAG: helix-turn-helix domain-containing protein [Cyanobacteria bacterium J06597_16]
MADQHPKPTQGLQSKAKSAKATDTLRSLMHRANIASYRGLAAQAAVSRWQVQQLKMGNIDQMRVHVLAQLAEALQVPLHHLLSQFKKKEGRTDQPLPPCQKPAQKVETLQQVDALQQEYRRLQAQMEQSVEAARSHLQTEALQTLETWLTQWPTIAQRAQENESLSAVKVLPFVKPVQQLMAEWGVEAIAPVNAEVAYDPQHHQLMGAVAKPGTLVRVTHSGALHKGKLLHRAKVKLPR